LYLGGFDSYLGKFNKQVLFKKARIHLKRAKLNHRQRRGVKKKGTAGANNFRADSVAEQWLIPAETPVERGALRFNRWNSKRGIGKKRLPRKFCQKGDTNGKEMVFSRDCGGCNGGRGTRADYGERRSRVILYEC
jgi:hypothetical protein